VEAADRGGTGGRVGLGGGRSVSEREAREREGLVGELQAALKLEGSSRVRAYGVRQMNN
jgi:hypothetical protein